MIANPIEKNLSKGGWTLNEMVPITWQWSYPHLEGYGAWEVTFYINYGGWECQ